MAGSAGHRDVESRAITLRRNHFSTIPFAIGLLAKLPLGERMRGRFGVCNSMLRIPACAGTTLRF